MGWDGAGGYVRQHNFSADASAGINILAARMDTEIDDVASAMTLAWARNGQNVPTVDMPMGGRKFVNVGAPTSVSNYMRAREFIENVPIFMQDAQSSADRISVSSQYFTSVSSNQAPVDGTKIMVRVGSNKSSAVLYLDGHSANVEYQGGTRIGPALTSGGIYEFTYSSADTAWKVINPDEFEPGDVRRYGCTANDGTTDESSAFQAAVDANKGLRVIIPAGHTVLAAGVLLDGSTYNNTTIDVRGTFKLKADAAATNFGGAWVGLIVRDCDNVTVTVRDSDGNRSNMTTDQHIYILGFAGATNFKVPFFSCREIRGDGIYIGQKTWTSDTTNSSRGVIGPMFGYNSADDGRNLLSIISCDDLTVESVTSYQIGGNVGAVMPGGLDIEPDETYQSCKNITIGTVNVTTVGTSGLAIQGRAGTDVTRNITIGSAIVVNTAAASEGSGDVPGVDSQTPNGPLVNNCRRVTIGSLLSRFTNAYGTGLNVVNSDYVTITGRAEHCRYGCIIGASAADATGDGVRYSDIDMSVTDIVRYGFNTGKITQTKVRGAVSSPVTGYYTSSLFGVIAIAHTQTDCAYSVSVVASADWQRSYRNDSGSPATFTRSRIRDCDLSGTWAGATQQIGDMVIPRYNVTGVTDANAMPSGGSWAQGTLVVNSEPSLGEVSAWARLTSNANNVLNTDWAIAGQSGFRTNAGTPASVLTPNFVGERAFDSSGSDWYTATGATNADWKQDSA